MECSCNNILECLIQDSSFPISGGGEGLWLGPELTQF